MTFRLADSLPVEVIERWKRGAADDEIRPKIAAYEDAGCGECWLIRPACAEVVAGALRHFDGDRYDLVEWVVMPNHVHVILKPHSELLERIVKSWKSFTAREINRLVGRSGVLWGRDYFDRAIRDGEHLRRARRYVRQNPVKAGLCREPEGWKWSSAWNGGKERRSSDRLELGE